jgi:hypothetical protein
MTKPPGHTCIAIDRAEQAMRQLHWRIRNSRSTADADSVLARGIEMLERVRTENAQMRAAYHEALAELQEKS